MFHVGMMLLWVVPAVPAAGSGDRPPAPVRAAPAADKLSAFEQNLKLALPALPLIPAPLLLTSPLTCLADESCSANRLCISYQCKTVEQELAFCTDARIHFSSNSSVLTPDEQIKLDRVARCLRADRKLRIVVEGNTDSRGSAVANLALGEHRAMAVEKYLVQKGATPAQLETVSYGYEKPLCAERNDACWTLNRRVELAVRSNR